MLIKNKSEELFEKYLKSQDIKFDYEKLWTHTTKKPDYTISHNNEEIIFDVTEFDKTVFDNLENEDFGYILKKFKSKTSPLRNKIEEKKKQLKPFADKSCNIVIYPPSHPMWFVEPSRVYESMYGDVAVISSYDQSGYVYNSSQMIFDRNGKMKRTSKPYISSIIVLRQMDKENLGIIVFENYYADKNFPRNIFRGEYDVRYGIDGNKIKQIFVGKEVSYNPDEYKNFTIAFS